MVADRVRRVTTGERRRIGSKRCRTRLYFTDSDEANELIAKDPMALLIGFALDQQVTVPKAFSGPLAIKERVGTLDPAKLAADRPRSRVPRETGDPPLPRENGRTGPVALDAHPRRLRRRRRPRVDATRRTAPSCARTSKALPGFGEMKVKALGSVLAKRYKLAKAKSLVPPHPTLGDVDSPQALLDYQAAKRAHKAEWSKMKA